MTQEIATPVVGAPPTASTGTNTNVTKALLTCGVAAGPLFIAVALTQAFTRSEFDLSSHPPSLLSLGGLGWIQITNFVVVGLLFLAFAIGMRQDLGRSRAGTWGPRLTGVVGVSFIAGGAFVIDRGFGFPPGTPPGSPTELSWHGILHGLAPIVAFLSLIAVFVVFARRFASLGRRRWAAARIAAGVIVLALNAWPNLGGDPEGKFAPLWVGVALGFGWTSAIAARLVAERRDEPT
jgi:hypothetical protein